MDAGCRALIFDLKDCGMSFCEEEVRKRQLPFFKRQTSCGSERSFRGFNLQLIYKFCILLLPLIENAHFYPGATHFV